QLEVQPRADPGAQAGQALLGGGVLRQDQVEGGEQLAGRARDAPPAAGARLSHPGGEQSQAHAALAGRGDQVRPEFALHEEPGGRRWAIIAAEVTVAEVTSRFSPGRLVCSASTSGSSERLSPTLTPCSQTSGPSGRATAARPSRSPSRATSSLPRPARDLSTA